MDLFSWIFVLEILFSLGAVIMCTLMHFNVICLLDVISMTFDTDVGYFLPIIGIHTLVPYI